VGQQSSSGKSGGRCDLVKDKPRELREPAGDERENKSVEVYWEREVDAESVSFLSCGEALRHSGGEKHESSERTARRDRE